MQDGKSLTPVERDWRSSKSRPREPQMSTSRQNPSQHHLRQCRHHLRRNLCLSWPPAGRVAVGRPTESGRPPLHRTEILVIAAKMPPCRLRQGTGCRIPNGVCPFPAQGRFFHFSRAAHVPAKTNVRAAPTCASSASIGSIVFPRPPGSVGNAKPPPV
jgi:hypothetical protein